MLQGTITQLREWNIEFYLPKVVANDKENKAIPRSNWSKVVFEHTSLIKLFSQHHNIVSIEQLTTKKVVGSKRWNEWVSRICKRFKCFTFLIQRKLLDLIKMDQTVKEEKTRRNLMTFACTRILYAITRFQLFRNI